MPKYSISIRTLVPRSGKDHYHQDTTYVDNASHLVQLLGCVVFAPWQLLPCPKNALVDQNICCSILLWNVTNP